MIEVKHATKVRGELLDPPASRLTYVTPRGGGLFVDSKATPMLLDVLDLDQFAEGRAAR